MTGAPVPPGAGAVIMIEHVSEEHAMPQSVTIASRKATTASQDAVITPRSATTSPPAAITLAAGRTVAFGANIVPRGREATAGAVLLAAGTVLGPAEIALAASAGAAHVRVVRRPRVAILSTGDELVELAGPDPAAPPLAAHQIRNSNSYALAALVAEAGGDPWRLPIARDTRESLRAVLAEAAAADLILLTGGVSMGRHDLVEEVLVELGATFHFTGVRMQPGKPVVFGTLPTSDCETDLTSPKASQSSAQSGEESSAEPTHKPLFGLPGNPISTEVTFRCFVAPVLRALAGEQSPATRFALAHLTGPAAANSDLTRLLPARLTGDHAGVTVRLIPWQGSGDLAANARANGYAVLPPGTEPPCAGDLISVLLR